MSAAFASLRPLYKAATAAPETAAKMSRHNESAAELARLAASTGKNDREVLVILGPNDGEASPLFYSNRPIMLAAAARELQRHREQRPIRGVIMSKGDFARLSAPLGLPAGAVAGPLVFAPF